MHDLVIKNANVLHLDVPGGRIRACDILVKGGKIQKLAPANTTATALNILEADGGLVMAGLVNAHTHSPENLQRGRSERAQLDTWLKEIWSRIDDLPSPLLTLAIEAGAAEMIGHGITCVVDHFRQTPMSERALTQAVETYSKIGLRTMLAVMLRDARDSSGALVGAPYVTSIPTAREQVSLVLQYASWARDKGVELAFGPSAPHRCSDQLLEALAADAGPIHIHTHVDETHGEAELAHKRFGRSEISHLDRLGLLGPRTSCAHLVHISGTDTELLAERGAVAIHNPISNLRLGAGVANLPNLLKHGVKVAIGTDGAASNDSQNLWEALKMAALLPRVSHTIDQWPSSETILKLASEVGHHVTSLAEHAPGAGIVAPGAPADLAIFANDPLGFMDLDQPATSLVLGSTARKARHVVANGRTLLRDGRLTTIDEESLHRRLADYLRKVAA